MDNVPRYVASVTTESYFGLRKRYYASLKRIYHNYLFSQPAINSPHILQIGNKAMNDTIAKNVLCHSGS